VSVTTTRGGHTEAWDPATVLAGCAVAVITVVVAVTTAAAHLALRLFGWAATPATSAPPPASGPVHAAATHAHAHSATHALTTAAQPPTANAHPDLPGNPFTLTLNLFTGAGRRPEHLLGTAIALSIPLILLFVLAGTWLLGRSAGRLRVDAAARHLASGRELEHLSTRGAAATAHRLGAVNPDATPAGPGLPIGTTVTAGLFGRGQVLVQGWEDV
jgi:hypothetical protein